MDESKIRAIVKDEMRRSDATSRFNFRSIPFHIHDGKGSEQIQENDIIPSANISGSITFAQATRYTLRLNASFTPSFIMAYGNVVGTSGERFLTTGTASLSRGYYFQPETTTSVQTGDVEYPLNGEPLQSAVYIGVDSGGTHRTLLTETNIVSIEYGGNIHARATIVDFSRESIIIDIPNLDSGWEMNINYVIT